MVICNQCITLCTQKVLTGSNDGSLDWVKLCALCVKCVKPRETVQVQHSSHWLCYIT